MKEWVSVYRAGIALFIALLSYLAIQTYERVDSLKSWAVQVNERGTANRNDIDEIKKDVKHVNQELSEIQRTLIRLDQKMP